MIHPILRSALVLAVAAAVAPAWASQDLNVGMANTPNAKPSFAGDIRAAYYGATAPASPANPAVQDLLTAGIGKSGLGSAVAPGFVNPLAPTALELRQRAIHTNYRAVLDTDRRGGYGTLYGPNVDKNGNVTASEGMIAGCEYIAYADDGSGTQERHADGAGPRHVRSGQGVHRHGAPRRARAASTARSAPRANGASRTAARSPTPTRARGNGLHDLDDRRRRPDRRDAHDAPQRGRHRLALHGDRSPTAERAAYNAAFPNRVAFKHAHSQQNPEEDWGTQHAAGGRVRVLRAERAHVDAPAGPRRQQADRARPAQHAGDRVGDLERRPARRSPRPSRTSTA